MAIDEATGAFARIEQLLEGLEALPDPAAREHAIETVRALLEFYGEGLGRLVGHVAEHDDGSLAAAVAADDLVAHMLLLHGLHPVPLEARIQAALDGVRPYLGSHGGGVELLGVEEGVARLRLEGSCNGCPSSRVTMKLAIEKAVLEAAPDLDGIEAEGGDPPPAPSGLLQIEIAGPLAPAPVQAGDWVAAGAAAELEAAAPVVHEVAGEPLLFLRVGAERYAYRPDCPACGRRLDGAVLLGVELGCAGCGARYDVHLAGRRIDGFGTPLEPVPLLVDDAGAVRVALGTAA